MNKELIKKYKKEFDYWLDNPSNLLFRFVPGYTTLKDTNWRKLEECGDDWTWTENYTNEILIIINDEYVEFRKALAEGKTIQTKLIASEYPNAITNAEKRTEWIDFDIKTNKFIGYTKYYRIKPEEPKFKVGDFVRVTSPSGEKFVSAITSYRDGNQVILDHTAVAYISDCEIWKSEADELCWFYSELHDLTVLSNYYIYSIDSKKYWIKNNDSLCFDKCEPFLNSKPSWLKD